MVPTRLMPMEVMVCSIRFGSECSVLEFVPMVYSKSLSFLQSAGYGGWGEYSTYLSHDGAQTPTAVSDSSCLICCSPCFRSFQP